MIIIGAGMAGCIAAIMNPNAVVLEASKTPSTNHNAVLRFREDVVSQVTGIPFEKVTVRKAIWMDGKEQSPSPRLCNLYSKKVTGKILDRSIWNLDTVQRYVAPSDFHQQMIDMIGDRINYDVKVDGIDKNAIAFGGECNPREDQPIISTMPIHIMNKIVFSNQDKPYGLLTQKTEFQKISTIRGKVKGSDVNQTIYYPSTDTSVYRATLTGEDLIIEFMDDDSFSLSYDLAMVCESFGLSPIDEVLFDENPKPTQQYGKIAPIDDKERRQFIFRLSTEFGIYSLGRFGTWRNILLDDVVDDVNKIKQLIQNDLYGNHLAY